MSCNRISLGLSSDLLKTLFFCFLRLKDVEPVSYCETEPKKEKHSEDGKTAVIEIGAKEEIYTEEHDKLLGTCSTPWALFVDGYGKDGKRIYDQVRGQTCHQCR